MADKQTTTYNRSKRKHIIADKRHSGLKHHAASEVGATSSAAPAIITAITAQNSSCEESILPNNGETSASSSYGGSDLGLPEYTCQFCGAIFWYAERVKSVRSAIPIFPCCCKHGRIKLPRLRDAPPLLKRLLDYNGGKSSRLFRENIRIYNSMFAFTSIGAKINHEVNLGCGPYVFKINGQNHHLIGSLLPPEGERPHFAQLYIYDTDNEAANRVSSIGKNSQGSKVEDCIVSELIEMFDENNELVKVFRMARDRFLEGQTHSMSLKLSGKRCNDGSQYNAPTAAEMAGLIVGDLGHANQARDIVVEYQSRLLKRIDDLHPNFMAMQYPILFPYGEDGFTLNMPYQECPNRPQIKRGTVTRREYYSYQLQQRIDDGTLLIRGGKLYQQYIVDAFTCIEDERLRYIRFKHQQEHFRCELYKGVQDAFLRGDVDAKSVGQRVILPSSFTGGPRYMTQNYHDAMAICRSRGNPDLFITFTCNVRWPEIENVLKLIPGQKPEDRPDIVSRVFHMKLNEFIADIKTERHFGRVVGAIYTVEFQKRGLPHVHVIIWLHDDDKHPTTTDIDKIICAEIPSVETEPELYDVVSKFMIHGPCGLPNPKAPCMKNNNCVKHFPKKN